MQKKDSRGLQVGESIVGADRHGRPCTVVLYRDSMRCAWYEFSDELPEDLVVEILRRECPGAELRNVAHSGNGHYAADVR